MTRTLRLILSLSAMLVVVLVGGFAAYMWAFLDAMHVGPLEALEAVFR